MLYVDGHSHQESCLASIASSPYVQTRRDGYGLTLPSAASSARCGSIDQASRSNRKNCSTDLAPQKLWSYATDRLYWLVCIKAEMFRDLARYLGPLEGRNQSNCAYLGDVLYLEIY